MTIGVCKGYKGKYEVRLYVFGVQTYFGSFTHETAVKRAAEILAQYPNRKLRRVGCVFPRHGKWRATLKNRRLGTFPSKYHAEQAIAKAANQSYLSA